MGPLGAFCLPSRSKMAPRPPQDASKMAQEASRDPLGPSQNEEVYGKIQHVWLYAFLASRINYCITSSYHPGSRGVFCEIGGAPHGLPGVQVGTAAAHSMRRIAKTAPDAQWPPLGSHGSPWVPMDLHRPRAFPWAPMGFQWVPHGSPWVPNRSPIGPTSYSIELR